MVQLHKKFNDDEVRELLKRYIEKKIERKYLEEILEIKKRSSGFPLAQSLSPN